MNLRALDRADIPAALRLSEQAGWNQVGADWAYMLRAGSGFGVTNAGGALVATAIALPYGDAFGWISMVLVDRDERGGGLATRVLEPCLDLLHASGRTAIVDATPAGRPIYAGMGFRDGASLKRLRCAQSAALPPTGGDATVRPATDDDLDAIVALDAAAFGAPRRALIAELFARMPHLAFVAEQHGAVCGFGLARNGRTATQLGPVVAPDDDGARELIAAALRGAEAPLVLDVPDRRANVQRMLFAAGFAEERPFTRMQFASSAEPGNDRTRFAIAGPELG